MWELDPDKDSSGKLGNYTTLPVTLYGILFSMPHGGANCVGIDLNAICTNVVSACKSLHSRNSHSQFLTAVGTVFPYSQSTNVQYTENHLKIENVYALNFLHVIKSDITSHKFSEFVSEK